MISKSPKGVTAPSKRCAYHRQTVNGAVVGNAVCNQGRIIFASIAQKNIAT